MRLDPAVPWALLAGILGAAVCLAAEIARRRRAGPMLFDLGFNRPWSISPLTSPTARLAFGIPMLLLGGFEIFSLGPVWRD